MRQFPLPPTAGQVDGRLLGFSLLLSLITACVFGVLPALRSIRIDPVHELKGAGAPGAPTSQRTRLTLVTVQVALSFALLVGAGLFVRSLGHVSAVQGGADLSRLLTVEVNLSGSGSKNTRPYNEFFELATSRLSTVPGVQSAALVHTPPFSRWGFSAQWRLPGQSKYQVGGTVNVAGAGYFEAAGTRLLSGRTIQSSDGPGGEPIAVVNEAMARLLAADGDSVGLCVSIRALYLDRMPCVHVVGIVESQRNDYLKATPAPIIFLPEPQVPVAFPRNDMMLLVRTDGPAPSRRGAVQAALQALRDDLPYVSVEPLAARLKDQLRPIHLGAVLFSLFGVLALVLSAIGLGGVLGYFVAERTSEVGIRRALGAPADSVVRLVLRQGLVPVCTGLVFGFGLALTGARVLESRLFGIGPYDPVAFVSAAGFLLTLAAVATTLPIVRALRIDPMVALRQD
jgi:predicted permease